VNHNTSEIISPFGPRILLSKCPNFIINSLNEYTDKVCSDEKLRDKYSSFGKKDVPNLLGRNLENIYLSNEFFKSRKIIDYLESIGNLYLSKIESIYGEINLNMKSTINVKKINGECIPDCWINRYFCSNYTPLHTHDSNLSGVIFLKIPKFLEQTNTHEESTFGRVFFTYGVQNSFCEDLWGPKQKVGTIIVFPSWLKHIAYPTNSDEERRTFSFNLNIFPIKNNKIKENNSKNIVKYY
jgi:hypothetical protein